MKVKERKREKGGLKMDRIDLVAKYATFALGSVASFVFGGLSMMMGYLLLANVLDFGTGYIAGAKTTGLSSKRNNLGIIKKVMVWAIIAAAHIVDQILGKNISVILQGMDLGIMEHVISDSHPIRDGVVFLYIMNELLSIIENVGKVTWVPSFFRKVVAVLKPPVEDEKGE